jgi:hypothetical protein
LVRVPGAGARTTFTQNECFENRYRPKENRSRLRNEGKTIKKMLNCPEIFELYLICLIYSCIMMCLLCVWMEPQLRAQSVRCRLRCLSFYFLWFNFQQTFINALHSVTAPIPRPSANEPVRVIVMSSVPDSPDSMVFFGLLDPDL